MSARRELNLGTTEWPEFLDELRQHKEYRQAQQRLIHATDAERSVLARREQVLEEVIRQLTQ